MRADWKNNIIQTIERTASLPPIELESHSLSQSFIENNPYRSFLSRGKFDLNSHIFIGPKTMNGTPGYHLYVLFQPKHSQPIWMLCGWTETRLELGNILSRQEQTLTFTLDIRAEKGAFTPENNPAKNQWYWPDARAMSAHLGTHGEHVGKLITSFAPASPLLVPVNPFNLPPNRHLEYAFTWMALSVMLALLGIIFCMKQWKAIHV